MINIVLWILFGALAGWIASIIMKTNAEQGAVGNVVVGIVGAFVGGFLVRALSNSDVNGFNLASLLTAVLGAVVLLAVYKALRGRNATHV